MSLPDSSVPINMSASRDRVLVSGGAGGIGTAVCTLLTARGLTPIIGYHRDAAKARALAASVGGEAIALDLSSPESISAACAEIMRSATRVIGVVLAASPPPALGPFGKIADTEMLQQWHVNVRGPQQLVAELVRGCFRKSQRGTIVGVLSSAMGEGIGSAASNMGAYVIAKYGMLGMLAAAKADYAWLQVHTVSPWFTDTPMLDVFDKRFLDAQRAHTPFRTPTQVADDVVTALLAP